MAGSPTPRRRPDNRRPGRPGRRTDGRRLRAAGRGVARVVRRVSGRVRRAAGHAFAASVTTYGSPTEGQLLTAVTRRATTVRRTPRFAGRSGPGAPVLVVAAVMMLIVTMLGVEWVTGVSMLPDRLTAGLRPPPRDHPVLAASPPTSISIPTISVDAPVHPVGIAADGTIGVPDSARAQEGGWYDQGPTPGQDGPAVIVGHVDTSTGPAVFHRLKELDEGDRVQVSREDGAVAVFEVESVDRFDKDRFPADQVFGDFSRPHLRLVTCGGRWVGGATGYADNVVVFASLVDAHR
ncbi:class F sortase [Micromonospora sp. NPDC000207]|uniref:class F sortase n=1 Tax=Micromonospora sp. NPDC000207 TaxID=3154246 RepID=UPI00332FF0D2